MADDEKLIGRGYRNGGLLSAAPGVAGYFGGEKFAIYAAFVALVYLLTDIGSRLYDQTIRQSRTNELLVDGHDERRGRKE